MTSRASRRERLSGNRVLSLTDFLALFPNVKPRKARSLILAGEVLRPREQEDLHRRDTFYETIDVGPDAATAILCAYRESRLPMNAGAPTKAPLAEAYIAKRDELLATLSARHRRKRALDDVSLVTESDLNDHLFIDRIFLAHLGPGNGRLTLGGIEVTKTLTFYSSNSGKTGAWAVRFDWTGSDGVRFTSDRQPPQASNRRNDSDRNWGLPD